MTGRVLAADVLARPDGGTSVGLDIEPYGSRVLIFSQRSLPRPQATNSTSVSTAIDLSDGWRVSFGDNSPVIMDHLHSWTDDPDTRYFSGVAVYEKEIEVRENMLQDGGALRLDFGQGQPIPAQTLRAGMQAWFDPPVREAAVVYVNGQRAGSVWCPPYSLDLTNLLRPGANKIRIVVANLALNHMAGTRLPDYRLLNLRYGERFQAQDMDKIQPVPAGLLGPIRLVATQGSKP